MPTSDPIDILIAHDRWATQNILNASEALTGEQFHQRFEMGAGSLHDTLVHMLSAMRNWSDLLAGREFAGRIEGQSRSIIEINKMLEDIAADFAASAKAHPLDGLVIRERDNKSYTFTRGAVITHVATHGMHHRAQCLNMLRHLGITAQPPSSIMQWTLMADPLR